MADWFSFFDFLLEGGHSELGFQNVLMVVMLRKVCCEGPTMLLMDGRIICEVGREVPGGLSDLTVPGGLFWTSF